MSKTAIKIRYLKMKTSDKQIHRPFVRTRCDRNPQMKKRMKYQINNGESVCESDYFKHGFVAKVLSFNSLTFPFWCPRQESNLQWRLRKPLLYSFFLGGGKKKEKKKKRKVVEVGYF